MDAPVYALHRRLCVFYRGLPAYDASVDVWLVQKAERVDLDFRHADFHRADGGGICGLRLAMGPDVLLGCAGHYFPVWRHSRGGRRYCDVDPRRLFDLRHHVEPVFCLARCRIADSAACLGCVAYSGATRGGFQQPGWR